MKNIVNHYHVKPRVNLTKEIRAIELVKPGKAGKLSAHKIWIPANAEYPPHKHPSPHIIVILEGGGYMKCGQGKREVHALIKAGDVFHVGENVPHQVGADSRGMVMIAISVDSKSLNDPERMVVLLK